MGHKGPVTERAPRTSIPLIVAAIGVVFGDIGTSPLYTLKVCLGLAGITGPPPIGEILGICSLLFWALVLVVCWKYVTFIMRVDHDGQGGDLALLALASGPRTRQLLKVGGLTLVVVIGTSMLLGDGIITPAISVLSAVEGIDVASSAAQRFVVPISLVVLLLLFALQSRGTEKVGRLFGPVMVLWFVSIGVLGLRALVPHPEIIWAVDPRHALAFVSRHGALGFTILGGVVLAITGVEALYTDLSHFGRKPIVSAWFALVFPALVLCYFGQGALLLRDPSARVNPFYALAPPELLVPMVVLATIATVIASQALISGTFTVVEQAIALNLAPRVLVLHTSHHHRGQVFVPSVNRFLALGCALLILGFQSSDRLAAAYGLAVAFTMSCTSFAYYAVITKRAPLEPRALHAARRLVRHRRWQLRPRLAPEDPRRRLDPALDQRYAGDHDHDLARRAPLLGDGARGAASTARDRDREAARRRRDGGDDGLPDARPQRGPVPRAAPVDPRPRARGAHRRPQHRAGELALRRARRSGSRSSAIRCA